MPIAGDPYNPNFNVANMAVEGAFHSPQAEQLPAFFDVAQHYPRYSTAVGSLAFRGSNTILGGGFADRSLFRAGAQPGRIGGLGAVGRGGYVRQGIRHHNPLRARTWMRMGDQSLFHHTGPTWSRAPGGGKAGPATYNPFYASQFINWMGRRAQGGEGFIGRGSAAVLNAMPGTQHWMSPDSELMSKGFLGRVTAAGRLGMMSDAKWARTRQTGHLGGFLREAGFRSTAVDEIMRKGPNAAKHALLVSGSGTLSSYVGGFTASAGRPMEGTVRRALHQAVRDAGYASGKGAAAATSRGAAAEAALRGSRVAAQWGKDIGLVTGRTYTARQVARQGMTATRGAAAKAGTMAATKIAGKAGMIALGSVALPAAPFVAAAGWLWLAHDVAKMGTKAAGHAGGLFVEAGRSLRGDLTTGIMGRTFRDNEVTMTSRSRGVQAIQNSRLNARSILGNEAGAMAAHFG